MPGADGPGKREGSGRSPRARGAVPMERPERPGKAMGTGRHGWLPREGDGGLGGQDTTHCVRGSSRGDDGAPKLTGDGCNAL